MTTTALDHALERDRAYFAAHPDQTYYDRPLIPGEFGDGGGSGIVRVTQIAPGLRNRRVIAGDAFIILTHEMIETPPAPMPEWLLSRIKEVEWS